MCVALDKIESRGFERGIEQGIESNKYETAVNLLNMGLSMEQVAQGATLILEKVRQIPTGMRFKITDKAEHLPSRRMLFCLQLKKHILEYML